MLMPLRAVTPEPLLWVQPRRFRREFELRAGRETVASLRGPDLLLRRARGETAEGRYRLRVTDLFRGIVVVHPGDSDSELAVWRPRITGAGTVRFSGGRSFEMRPLDVWHRRWIAEDEAGAAIFTLHLRLRFLRTEASLELKPGAERVPELPVLLLLAWYIRVRAHYRRTR
jgi:hypothetical protein